MFNADFFPTPLEVIEQMMEGETIKGKVFLEPSAGKGNIVDYLNDNEAKNVLVCENNEDLKAILQTKCRVIENDFLSLTSDKISHIDCIVMNPPFSADEAHILHAYNIAPSGCKIIALCNTQTIDNPFSKSRKELVSIIESKGTSMNLGDCFREAERKTGVGITLVKITKPGNDFKTEFNGFFEEEEPEEAGSYGIMSYNLVRDIVNRYVQSCKIYYELVNVKSRLNSTTGSFFGGDIGVNISLTYQDYKKELQKAGWKHLFDKMNLRKNVTRGLMEDINKFVEQQTNIPFTMKNIYHMLDMVHQTRGQTMDKAILEVFDRVTSHHHDNRQNIKGWKTNSHFLVCKKFILPNMINPSKEYGYTSNTYNSLRQSYDGTIPDFEKALCYVTGKQYEESEYINHSWVKTGIQTVNSSINRNIYGDWYTSEFFRYKGYKNGNMHFEFLDEKIWEQFNQRVAKLKGYPLYESKPQTAYQKRQTGATDAKQPQTKTEPQREAKILATIRF